MKDFNLSEKTEYIDEKYLKMLPIENTKKLYKEEDVKKFIEQLKVDIDYFVVEFKEHHTLSRSLYSDDFFGIIDDLAGEKLI